MSKEYLEITEQLELFKKRGMIVENEEKALEKLVERNLAPFSFLKINTSQIQDLKILFLDFMKIEI